MSVDIALTEQLATIVAAWGPAAQVKTSGVGLTARFPGVAAPLAQAFGRIQATAAITVTAPARVGAPLTIPLNAGRFPNGVGYFARCEPLADGAAFAVEMQLFNPAQVESATPPAVLFALLDEVLGHHSDRPTEALVAYLAHRLASPAQPAAARRRLLAELSGLVTEHLVSAAESSGGL